MCPPFPLITALAHVNSTGYTATVSTPFPPHKPPSTQPPFSVRPPPSLCIPPSLCCPPLHAPLLCVPHSVLNRGTFVAYNWCIPFPLITALAHGNNTGYTVSMGTPFPPCKPSSTQPPFSACFPPPPLCSFRELWMAHKTRQVRAPFPSPTPLLMCTGPHLHNPMHPDPPTHMHEPVHPTLHSWECPQAPHRHGSGARPSQQQRMADAAVANVMTMGVGYILYFCTKTFTL